MKSLEELLQIKLKQNSLNMKGVLVHGQAGIGKSLMIQTAIQSFSARLQKKISVTKITPADLIQTKDAQQLLNQAFESLIGASLEQPAILWLEEVDYIAKTKNLFYGLLQLLDSFNAELSTAIVIATTSKLGDVDKSLRRGGRLDFDIRLDMPSADDRFSIL